MTRIFISYRRDDNPAMACRIRDCLKARFGAESVFMDIHDIKLGSDFREAITECLTTCDAMIVVIGDKWLGSGEQDRRSLHGKEDPVRLEIKTALEQKVAIVPVLLDSAQIPPRAALPKDIQAFANYQGTFVHHAQDFDHHMDRLIQGLEELAGKGPKVQRAEREHPRPAGAEAAGTPKDEAESGESDGISVLLWGGGIAAVIVWVIVPLFTSWCSGTRAPGPWATLAAEPASIEPDRSASLTWETQDASEIRLEPGLGTVPATGSIVVFPGSSTTYTLVAQGATGTTEKQVLVFVAQTPEELSIVELIRDAYAQKGFSSDRFHLVPSIPPKALAKVEQIHYGLSPDDVLLVLDDTALFRNAKNGLVLTPEAILWKEDYEPPHRVAYRDIGEVISQGNKKLLINRVVLKVNYAENAEEIRDFLAVLLRRLASAAQEAAA